MNFQYISGKNPKISGRNPKSVSKISPMDPKLKKSDDNYDGSELN